MSEFLFQSTPPARGATTRLKGVLDEHGHISIHAPREGGDVRGQDRGPRTAISIHAPREGGDHLVRRDPAAVDYFNPRPP